MRRKPFSVIYALWPWPLDLKIYRAHPWLMGSLHVKFHDDRCKGKAVMHWKPFSVIYVLWPWPLTSKSIGHILASWGVCMWSFMMIVVKGKQLCAGNPNAAGQTDGRTDGQTDGHGDSSIPPPPNFVVGGIITDLYLFTELNYWLVSVYWTMWIITFIWIDFHVSDHLFCTGMAVNKQQNKHSHIICSVLAWL